MNREQIKALASSAEDTEGALAAIDNATGHFQRGDKEYAMQDIALSLALSVQAFASAVRAYAMTGGVP